MNEIIIDVRELDEFQALHIEGSINLPLSKFSNIAEEAFKDYKDKKIIFMCRSGKRAGLAHEETKKLRISNKIETEVYPGGIIEWQKEGRPVTFERKFHLPVLRQVHLIAGMLVFLGVVLATFVSPYFMILSGFVGLGLMFAGATGTCLMGELLIKMPWNRVDPCGSCQQTKE